MYFAMSALLSVVGIITSIQTYLIGGVIDKIHIVYILYGSMIMMILAIPFIVIRIKSNPDAR